MKKNVKIIVAGVLCAIIFAGCGQTNKSLYGSWYTEKNGVGMTVSFGSDGTMSTVCKIVDKAAASTAGINEDMLKKMNISCWYGVDKRPALSKKEKDSLGGKMRLNQYSSAENMKKNKQSGHTYFVVKGKKFVTTQKTGSFNKTTGNPVYSDTVFEKSE
ncbi:MAG: hypothetical protein Q8873_00895 [Bacillota bacterium]|nr:hypothetical protein [Bacillota bacterium]